VMFTGTRYYPWSHSLLAQVISIEGDQLIAGSRLNIRYTVGRGT